MEDMICKGNILHIVNRQKFTSGYINFMEVKMKEYQHTFLVLAGKPELDLVGNVNVLFIENYRKLVTQKAIRKLIHECDKIIISGVFNAEMYMLFYSKKIWKKIYLHFWGGDFYFFRECPTVKRKIRKMLLGVCIKRATVLNLIPHDFEALKEVFPDANRHMVAAMPANLKTFVDYKKYRNLPKKDGKTRIVIGNSATIENQHIEIFELLKNKITLDIEIYCILSYGPVDYRDYVIEEGKRCFGEQFFPITKYMEREQFIAFLSEMDIGIYNNNRQQGMGNIKIMASMGKKLYLRDDTSMWKYYQDVGYIFNRVDELKECVTQEMIAFDEKIRDNNCAIADTLNVEKHIDQWKNVLDDRRGT